jgi:hypothetical protein
MHHLFNPEIKKVLEHCSSSHCAQCLDWLKLSAALQMLANCTERLAFIAKQGARGTMKALLETDGGTTQACHANMASAI